MFKKINIRRILSYGVYFLLVSFLVSSVTLSRYMVNVSSNGELTVASYAMDSAITTTDDTASTQETLYIGGMQPGDAKEYTFTVKNYIQSEESGNVVCSVDQEYVIEILSTCNLPLSFSIVEAEESEAEESPELLTEIESEVGLKKYTTEEISLGSGEEIDHVYTLIISWDSDDASLSYIGEVDKVTIMVNAWQTVETES